MCRCDLIITRTARNLISQICTVYKKCTSITVSTTANTTVGILQTQERVGAPTIVINAGDELRERSQPCTVCTCTA